MQILILIMTHYIENTGYALAPEEVCVDGDSAPSLTSSQKILTNFDSQLALTLQGTVFAIHDMAQLVINAENDLISQKAVSRDYSVCPCCVNDQAISDLFDYMMSLIATLKITMDKLPHQALITYASKLDERSYHLQKNTVSSLADSLENFNVS